MDADRWDRIQTLFHEALERSPEERRAFLDRACADDPSLVEEVSALLEEDAAVNLLDGGLSAAAGTVLGGEGERRGTLGRYRLLGVLGRGGMGVVYLAERPGLPGRVALKVLRDAWLSPARRERFEREQRTLAALSHPAVARLYDADVTPDGTPFFAMEYVDGRPLTDHCRVRGCSLEERLRLFAAVCRAVRYAHGQAVLHRDLKPSNIFVYDGADGRPAVKLLDFGIARQLGELDADVARTQTGLRLLTPAYAAPEQLRGEPVGLYTDVYALGVVLYELLTGTLPFDVQGRSPGEVERKVLETEPEHPSARVRRHGRSGSVGRHTWADLDVLCLTAMHRDPRRRYASAEALLRDVEALLEGRPLEARPDAPTYRLRKFARRNRRPLAAAAAVALLLVGLAAYHTERLADERDRARAEAASAEQMSDYLIGLFEASDPYAADTAGVAALLARGAERAEALAGQPAAQARMLDALGRVHTLRSEYDRAGALLHRALALRRDRGEPLEVAETLANLGVLHGEAGAYDSAEVVLREALALRERHLPPRHPDLAVTLDRLGVVLNRRGAYREAETLYRLALRIHREARTAPHEETAATLNNLAVNLFDQGDYRAAEHYFRRALAMGRTLFGPDHPSIAVDLSNLGVLLDTQGRYEAADSVLTEALRIKRLHLGEDHYETAFSLTQLGGMLRRKGDYERAERLLRRALAVEARVLGEGHRNTGVTLNHLGLTLQEQGRYREAEPLFRRMIAIFDEALGEAHPFTAVGHAHLADLLRHQGDPERAETLFVDALATLEAALPADHDLLALNRGKYGALLAEQSRYTEAEPLLLGSHGVLADRLGPEHPETRRAARRLAALYEATARPAEAERLRQVPLVADGRGAQ